MRTVQITQDISIGPDAPLALIAGPCVLESAEHLLQVGRQAKAIAAQHGFPYLLKCSFDKANRSSQGAFRGPGLQAGLSALERVKSELGVPLVTDVHTVDQVDSVASVADVLQIPAFLCRQTDLLCAAGRTGKPVLVKKGQFMAPADMRGAVAKITACGNPNVLLAERGTTFGYHNLVVDMRALIIMRSLGVPVVFDATHSVQLPGSLTDATGGERGFIPPLARAAAAVGMDALFLEVHDQPDQAPCDGPNMLPLSDLPALLDQVHAVDAATRKTR